MHPNVLHLPDDVIFCEVERFKLSSNAPMNAFLFYLALKQYKSLDERDVQHFHVPCLNRTSLMSHE